MPTIPTYDGPQVRQQGLPDTYQANQDISSGNLAIAKGLGDVAAAADKIDLQNATAEAQTAEVKIRQAWFDADSKLREQYSGDKIAGYNGAVAQWWADAPKTMGESLSNRAQLIASKSLIGAQEMAQRTSFHYSTAKREELLAQKATESIVMEQNSAIDSANKTGSPIASATYAANIIAKNTEQAQVNNWTPEHLALKNLQDTTNLHLGVIQALKTDHADTAMAYFDEIKKDAKQFDPKKVDDVTAALKPLADAQVGFNTTKEVWAAMGPKSLRDAVDVFGMEEAIDAKFPNDPAKRSAAKAAIKEKAAAFGASQNQFKAAAVNTFYDNIDRQHMPVSKALELAVADGMPREEAHRLNHTLTLEATARDGRDIQAMQRAETKLRLMGGPTYLEKSDPAVLAGMSRDEVRALRPDIGTQQTEQLLSTWDQLNTKEGKATAKMTQETFNTVADQLELKPYATGKSESEKARLGTLKAKMDLLADRMAKESPNKPVSQEDLMDRMRKEMSTEIVLKGFVWDDKKAVIDLKPEDLKKVDVPQADKLKAAAWLKAKYAANPIEAYAPTEDNMKRRYLATQSQTSAFIQ